MIVKSSGLRFETYPFFRKRHAGWHHSPPRASGQANILCGGGGSMRAILSTTLLILNQTRFAKDAVESLELIYCSGGMRRSKLKNNATPL
jgi:hypothetical protein